MIKRHLAFTVETPSGNVHVSRANNTPEAVSIKQGDDHVFMDDVASARDLRDALSELIENLEASA